MIKRHYSFGISGLREWLQYLEISKSDELNVLSTVFSSELLILLVSSPDTVDDDFTPGALSRRKLQSPLDTG